MGCVQAKCSRRRRRACCCCHYQPSTDSEAGELGHCRRVHDGSSDRVLSIGSVDIPSHRLTLQYASLTQRGHYPDSPDRENQDTLCIKTHFQGNPNLHLFAVFDGHGQFGTQCANFTRDRLPDILADNDVYDDPVKAYYSAFLATNSQLNDNSEIDDTMSGTTAITVLVSGDTLYIANVGDSRAVAGVWNGNCIAAEELSRDQTPFRKDEYERVMLCGARVLSVDQVEGIKDPDIQSWGDEESDEGDPPRLWVQDGMYPGTAFTRSVGDSEAEGIGVIAVPEVMTVKITDDHLFFVVASDGVFEFLSSQTVVDMAKCSRRRRRACCCCCHYQPSTDSEAGELGHCRRVHDGSSDRNVLSIGSVDIPSHRLTLQYASLTQRGHYPDSPDRQNQDALLIKTHFQGNPNLHLFAVFDGHGQFGTQCANFTRDRLPDILADNDVLLHDPVKAYNSAFLATNSQLNDNSEIDDTMSGTTAITVLVSGDTLYIANVGDSRAVAGVWNGNCIAAEELSRDQTPFRKDEYERVMLCGARVLSIDQVEGIKDPDIQSWGDEESDEGDPPRLWVQDGMYPGTAFTRSVGDSEAEGIGVIAVPEVMTVKITDDHLFFVVASDGVFEFLSSQTVVDMVARFADPRDACSAIAAKSYKSWLDHENRTDDITIIIVHIKDLSNSGSMATDETGQTNTKASVVVFDRGNAHCHTVSGSEPFRPKRGYLSELSPCPSGIPNEKSPMNVALSPVHSVRSAVTIT